jgi:hypothetical protein
MGDGCARADAANPTTSNSAHHVKRLRESVTLDLLG